MNNFRSLIPYLRLHWKQFVIGVLAVIFANSFSLLPWYFVRLVIDGLTGQTDLSASTAGIDIGSAGLYSLGIVVASLVSGGLMLIMRRNIVVASRQIEYELRRDLFAHLQTLDKPYYDRSKTGDLMNRMTGDLSAVREMVGFGGWQIVNIVASFSISLFVMLGLSWKLTLVIVVLIPFIVGSLSYLARLISKRHRAVQEQNSLIAAKAQENFSGARVVKGYAMEDREVEDYRAMNLELLKRNIALTKIEGPIRSFATLVIGFGFGAVLFVGGKVILEGDGYFTTGKLVQFLGILGRLAWPMMMIGWITGVTQRGLASWVRLREVLDAKPDVRDEPGVTNTDIKHISGRITFNNLSLSYGAKNVLSGVSIDVPAGTFLGITGPTGSGKTVLSQLITRSIDASDGVIEIDGNNIRSIPLTLLRENISVVPQEPFLFSDTIANNIGFGLNNFDLPEVATGVSVIDTPAPPVIPQHPDIAKVQKAASLAGLAGDIEDFSDKYDTVLGERGVTLSGGQRQRAAIARAIVRQPSILILDDSLSAVDTETERKIIDGIREVAKGRTVVMIAHRVSTLRHADTIVVLSDGKITEQGTHDELISLGGHYAEIERLQRLASDLEHHEGGMQ